MITNNFKIVKKYENEKVIHILFYATGETREEIFSIAQGQSCCRLEIAGEISPNTLNKGTAMLKVAKEYRFDKDELCSFGDGGNDIEMIEKAGLGVAMGNACKNLKDVADYVTDDISDEGLFNALVHFGFIKE